jgi:hypothetical protein
MQVGRAGVRAVVAGGATRTLSALSAITLDGSESSDLDYPSSAVRCTITLYHTYYTHLLTPPTTPPPSIPHTPLYHTHLYTTIPHTYIHTYIHTHTHTDIHTYTHTHTPQLSFFWSCREQSPTFGAVCNGFPTRYIGVFSAYMQYMVYMVYNRVYYFDTCYILSPTFGAVCNGFPTR